jgi:2-polyprenyl-3-methyl-5-hydroxy-6-metoxy-1,4-benzoquinol methylase
MRQYQVKDLVGVEPAEFRARINEFLDMIDSTMEGYQDPAIQRDLSIKFHWANDHDFGDFFVPGKMGQRHLSLIAALIDWFPVLPLDLKGSSVLDIGCWSGGTSLLLAAMGAHVVAVEEVKKYIDCLEYLKRAFALDRLDPRNLSLFECTADDLQDAFDYVLFAGVLYHVTDPVLALRITYNCLRDGGKCIVETMVQHTPADTLAYHGPRVVLDGSRRTMSRSGWNWFAPTPRTLIQMMTDVGFVDIHTSAVIDSAGGQRIFAVGTRDVHRDMTRAGLSVRRIR